jgi:copper chaperone CopZ
VQHANRDSVMKVEVLYFEGCPNHKPAVERVTAVLKQEGISEEVSEVYVSDQAAARVLGFLGSPSVRVNGLDVEPAARSSREYGMMCRTYLVEGRRVGLPSDEVIRHAVREAWSAAATVGNCCTDARAAAGEKSKMTSLLVTGSITGAVVASLCCILPIVFALTGLSILGAPALFAASRPYVLGLSFALLALGFYFAYRPAKQLYLPGCTMRSEQRSSRLLLWVTTAAAIFLAVFPYYSGSVAGFLLSSSVAASGASAEATLVHATFRIEGMDCAACATAIESRLKAVAGVRTVTVSFELKRAEIDYDPHGVTVAHIEKTFEDAGYRVRKG